MLAGCSSSSTFLSQRHNNRLRTQVPAAAAQYQACHHFQLPSSMSTQSLDLPPSYTAFPRKDTSRPAAVQQPIKPPPSSDHKRTPSQLDYRNTQYIGAYGMLEDVEKMNLIPAANLYNPIISGYFREKDIRGALSVLERMELTGVKPDSQTFLINKQL